MAKTERERTREDRKLNTLDLFEDGKTLYTNQIARELDIVWPVADRILKELVEEGRLTGDKSDGYRLPKESSIFRALLKFLHIKGDR